MASSIYPNGLKTWTDRRNRIDDVDASDVNSAYAEISSIQKVLGTNPHYVPLTPRGTYKTYANVGARLNAMHLGQDVPMWRLAYGSFDFQNKTEKYVGYSVVNDPYNYYNGSDITIPTNANGMYEVMVSNWWDFNANGYRWTSLEINGHEVANDIKAGSTAGSQRSVYMNFTWQGLVHAGDRLRVKVYQSSGKTLGAGAFQFVGHWVRNYDPTLFNT